MALDVRVLLQLTANLTSAVDLQTASAPLSFARSSTLVDGADAGEANVLWTDTRTVAGSATDSLDLAGSLTNAFGASITFARIKGLFVAAATTNVTDVRLTRPSSNAVPLLSAAGYLPIRPGGFFGWFDPSAGGVAVTAGTGDLVDFVNSGATAAKYDVVIIGAAS